MSKRLLTIYSCTILIITLLFSCASTSSNNTSPTQSDVATNVEIPEVFLNPTIQFPNDKFISGVGTGDSLPQAQQSALSALAQQFSVKVSSAETINSTIAKTESTTDASFDSNTILSTQSQAMSQEELIGVQYGESFTDNAGLVHAIAYIEREQASQIYKQKFTENEERIVALVKKSKSKVRLGKYALLVNALNLSKSNDTTLNQLNIIDTIQGKIASETRKYSTNELYEMTNTAAKNIRIITETSINGKYAGKQQQKIKNMVADLFSNLNFVTNANAFGEGIPYIALIKIIWEENADDKYPSISWSINIRFEENGEALISHSQSGKSKGKDIDGASEFAMKDIHNEISNSFQEYILSKLTQ